MTDYCRSITFTKSGKTYVIRDEATYQQVQSILGGGVLVPVNQGIANAGKFLKVDAQGNVTVEAVTIPSVDGLVTSEQLEQAVANLVSSTDLQDAIDAVEAQIPSVEGLATTEQLAEAVNGLASETYVQDAIEEALDDFTPSKQEYKNEFNGKVLSILGDSISTFAGWTPVADGHNLTHRNRYPQDNLFTDVKYCWWYKLFNDLGMKLGINDSWAGSRVHNDADTNSGDQGPDACMAGLTRITNLGSNGTPDVILFYGGTNDCGHSITLGSFDSTAHHSTVDLTSKKWTTFADAYKCAIMRLQYYYPDAKIVVMLPTYCTSYYTMGNLDKYNEVVKEICDYFGVPVLDLREAGINWQNKGYTLGDGIHPKALGADLIYRYVKQRLLGLFSFEAGERILHNLTFNLTNVTCDLSFWKKVSSGNKFVTTLVPDEGNLANVTVTMGGTNVTASCYDASTGKITINNVTGDVVISASADVSGPVWYTNCSYGSSAVNTAGYGWATNYKKDLTNKPINLVKFKTNLTEGMFEIGKVTTNSTSLDGLSDVQQLNFTSDNIENNICTLTIPNTITLASNESIVVFPTTQPAENVFLFGASDGTSFYTDVPVSRRGRTPWSAAPSSLGINVGYNPEANN